MYIFTSVAVQITDLKLRLMGSSHMARQYSTSRFDTKHSKGTGKKRLTCSDFIEATSMPAKHAMVGV